MKRPLFTPEELAEIAAADAEIEAQTLTMDEIRESRERDRAAKHEQKDKAAQKIAENKRAYYEANREKIAENQRAYYEANREKIAENKRAYYSKTEKREARRAYMREYMRQYNRRKKNGQDQDRTDAGGAEHAERDAALRIPVSGGQAQAGI